METSPVRVPMRHRKPLQERIDFSDASPFKLGGEYCKLISLTQGQFAIVSIQDYAWLMQWTWVAMYDPSRKAFYAKRLARLSNGRRENVAMHNEVLPHEPGSFSDHKDPWATLDNRRGNLRLATSRQNAYNRRKRSTSKNPFKGVSRYGKTARWMARISVDGVRIIVGVYDTPEQANEAFLEASQKHYGEFGHRC